jgi:hypothetical protein
MKIKYIIYTFLFVILFDDMIALYTGITISGKLSGIFLTIFIVMFFLQKKSFPTIFIKYISIFLIIILVNLFFQLLFNNNSFSLISFIYEVYKLGIFFTMFSLFFLNKKDSLNIVHFTVKLFGIFIVVNLIVLVFQSIFGAGVIHYLGINSSTLGFQIERNRPTGLTTGANIVGVASLFIFIIYNYLLSERIKFELSSKDIKYIKKMLFLSIFVIILSTSKQSLLLLLVYPLYIKSKLNLKMLLYLFLPLSILYFLYEENFYGIKDKLLMYSYFINNINSIDNSLLEHRALSIMEGINIFISNFPLGSGLGTWGDYSAALNNNLYKVNHMSDSYLIHLLVEQGFLLILYIWLLFTVVKSNKIGKYMFLSLLFVFLPTMGFASSTFPYLFSYFVFLVNFNNKEENRNVTNFKHVSIER